MFDDTRTDLHPYADVLWRDTFDTRYQPWTFDEVDQGYVDGATSVGTPPVDRRRVNNPPTVSVDDLQSLAAAGGAQTARIKNVSRAIGAALDNKSLFRKTSAKVFVRTRPGEIGRIDQSGLHGRELK